MNRNRNRLGDSSGVFGNKAGQSPAKAGADAASDELLELLIVRWLDFQSQAHRARTIEY